MKKSDLTREYVAKDSMVEVYFFSKRKFLMKKMVNCSEIGLLSDSILKSYMVVFSMEKKIEDFLLDELEKICREKQKYGPIVKMKKHEIYFFPKLNYKESFLIKNIFENSIEKDIDTIYFGKITV